MPCRRVSGKCNEWCTSCTTAYSLNSVSILRIALMWASSQKSKLKGRLKLNKRNQFVDQFSIRSAALFKAAGRQQRRRQQLLQQLEAHAPPPPQSLTAWHLLSPKKIKKKVEARKASLAAWGRLMTRRRRRRHQAQQHRVSHSHSVTVTNTKRITRARPVLACVIREGHHQNNSKTLGGRSRGSF